MTRHGSHYNLERAGKHKSAAEIKMQMDRCMLSIRHNHTKLKNAKKRRVAKAMRHHEHMLNVIALCVAQWAAQFGCLLVLEDLTYTVRQKYVDIITTDRVGECTRTFATRYTCHMVGRRMESLDAVCVAGYTCHDAEGIEFNL